METIEQRLPQSVVNLIYDFLVSRGSQVASADDICFMQEVWAEKYLLDQLRRPGRWKTKVLVRSWALRHWEDVPDAFTVENSARRYDRLITYRESSLSPASSETLCRAILRTDQFDFRSTTKVAFCSARQLLTTEFIAKRLDPNETDHNRRRLQARQIVDVFTRKRILMVTLKAMMFFEILVGRMVLAESTSSPVDRQIQLFTRIGQVLHGIVSFLWSILTTIWSVISSILVYFQSDCLLAIGDLVLFMFAVAAFYMTSLVFFRGVRCIYRALTYLFSAIYSCFYTNFTLTKTVEKTETSLISIEGVGENAIVRVMVDGVYYSLTQGSKSNSQAALENALPGSELYPSDCSQFGAVCVACEMTELTVVGLFFRIQDSLVTAQHVASMVDAGIADVYLAKLRKVKQRYVLDTSSTYHVPDGFFDSDKNVFKGTNDVFITNPEITNFWPEVGITKVSVKGKSAYNQIVSTSGIVNGIAVTSSGRTLPDSGAVHLKHSATTLKGFSGGPLWAGKYVVGMHTQGNNDHNMAVRIEYIMKDMQLESISTSSSLVIEKRHYDPKRRGRSVDIQQLSEDSYGSIDNEGRTDYYSDEEARQEFPGYFKRMSRQEEMDYEDRTGYMPDQQRERSNRTPKYDFGYEDENAELPKVIPSAPPAEEQTEFKHWNLLCKQRPIHNSSLKKDQCEVVQYLEENAEELKDLGFESEKYRYPKMTPQEENTSLTKHLTLFGERVASISKPVSDDEKRRCVAIMLHKMQSNRFEVKTGYKSPQRIMEIIESSVVKSAKNSGHPNQDAGLMTNEQVINKYTKLGLVQQVLDGWDDATVLKVFVKYGPEKIKKITEQMPRLVTGHSIQETIRYATLFMEFHDSNNEHWKESCVKYPFSPATPGHIKHLQNWLGDGKVMASDKPAWDYQMHYVLFEIIAEIVTLLAVQPHDMSDEEFEEWQKDASHYIKKIASEKSYRCSDGTVFVPKYAGAMSTGNYLTIDLNSMAQPIIDVLVSMRLGQTDEQINAPDHNMIAGGDDVIQRVPHNFDQDSYIDRAREMGFTLEPFDFHDSLDGCEFFSNYLMFHDGVWKFEPKRFTKVIFKLRKTKVTDLAGSLGSHMANYCWHNKKFNFFRKMYNHFRKEHPGEFPLVYSKSITEHRYKVLGYE